MRARKQGGATFLRLIKAAITAAAVATAAVSTITVAPSASAVSYVHNDCTATDTSHPTHCFRIHYNSRSETTEMSQSACLATRHSRSNEDGYSPNGATFINFVFGTFPSEVYGGMQTPCSPPSGSGQAVYHNAASAWNQDSYAGYTIYANTGYSGTSKYYPKADGYARNLSSGLKNHNGSHKRS